MSKQSWVEEIFNTHKPIIAMCHLSAMPGDPLFDQSAGMRSVIEWARRDLKALQNGGVDGVMFSNEFSMPYLTKVESVTIASMARVIGEIIHDIQVPFGVNALWDPTASIDLAVATGAQFVREVFTGVYAGDFGLWDTNCGAIVRHQHAVGAKDVKLLFNIVPEAARYLADREVVEIARSTVFNARPDALCVSGLVAGTPTDLQVVRKVKEAVGETVVFANTGVTIQNAAEQLAAADGAVVGTTFKHDGKFENHVDEKRVAQFMNKVHSIR